VETRNKINKGFCPVKEKKAKKIELKENKSPIFSEFSLDYIEKMRPKWRNKKHGEQWVSTIKTYAFPVIGSMPLDKIDTPQILEILSPIWLTKAETASRLRGRIEKVISAAITLKLKPPGNPASWRGHLENLLPTHRSPINHHAALHFEKIPEFMANLREMDSLSALALEFTILNASRTNEVLRAKRTEIHNDVWTIPASRMKAGNQHQVPLCERSLQI
jgi:integrase